MSMSGTFLVRSGILNSVHTFASDPERGLYILSFLLLISDSLNLSLGFTPPFCLFFSGLDEKTLSLWTQSLEIR